MSDGSPEYTPFVRAWRERWEALRTRDAAAAARARTVAERLARLLVERYGARRVILFGSVARGDADLGSDIDLAAEGLDPGALFRAGAEIERAAEGFEVDLVPLEEATAALRAVIAQEGVTLA